MQIVDLAGREREPSVADLLAAAQIHRAPEDAAARGPGIAAEYAGASHLELWGLEDGDNLIGVAGVEHRPNERLLRLNDLAVLEARRRTGAGRRLIDFLRVHYNGCTISGDTLAPAAPFYEALGFDLIEDGTMSAGEPLLRFTSAPRCDE